MTILVFGLGLAGLFFGGDWLVRGASGIAERFRVPPLVIGLTIVGFGTSTPELLVSLEAALVGVPGIAIGNVVGSNIFNLLLVLGVSSLVRPIPVPLGGGLDLLLVALLSLVLFLVSMTNSRRIIRTEAGLLLFAYLFYIVWRSGHATALAA